jgi:pimeloyl-ACP methyl ester carboxylesterase
MAKASVVLLHGVNSTGEWYDEAVAALRPHFNVLPFGYAEFAKRGFFHIFENRFRFWPEKWKPEGKETRTVMKLTQDFSKASRHGRTPHVIAHSFGTFLTAFLVRKHPFLQLDRIVFCGSPLSRRFKWEAVRKQVTAILNEFSESDGAATLADYSRFFLRGIGGAGHRGFKVRKAVVHTLDNPYDACNECIIGERAFVHNVPAGQLDHSEYFLGPGHIERFWLPFLWDINAGDYFRFLKTAAAVVEAEESGNKRNSRIAARLLTNTVWQCLENKSIRSIVLSKSWRRKAPTLSDDDLVGRAAVLIAKAVEKASAAREAHGRHSVIRALHPIVALQKAHKRF